MLALVLASSPVAADPVQATKLFEEGQALRKANKLDEACTKFEQSLALDPQLGTMLNLADCREAQGRLVDAHKLFSDGAALAARTDKKVRETFARQHADALIAKLGRVTLRVADPSLAQLEIVVGTRTLAATEWSAQQIVAPGKLVVIARAPDRRPTEVTVDVAAGAEITVDVPAPSLAGDLPPPRSTSPRASKLPWIVGGAGVALVAGSIGLGLSAKSSYNAAIDDNAPDTDKRIDKAQTRADLASGAFIVGAAAVAAGIVLYLRDRRGRVVVAPTGQRDGVGVWVSGPF